MSALIATNYRKARPSLGRTELPAPGYLPYSTPKKAKRSLF